MNYSQSARLANAKAVLRIMDEYPDHWSSRSSIQVKLDRIRSLVATMDAGGSNQRNADPKGFTNRKNEAFAALRTHTCELAFKLKDWASENHNPVVYQAVQLTPSDLSGASFPSQLAIARQVLSKGKEVVDHLEGYDVSPESLRSFEEQIKATEVLDMDRTVVKSHQLQATQQLEAGKKALGVALHALDELMTGFNGEKDADFVNAYRNVRGMLRLRRYKTVNGNQPPKEVPKA